MPYSSDAGKHYIKELVTKIQPRTVLDVGAGYGTYPRLLKDCINAEWTAIEIWPKYIADYNLDTLYSNIYLDNVITWVPDKQYDLVILGDVIEHMEVNDAINVINKMKSIAKTVIVSIPLGYYPQDEYENNPYEKHITDNWTADSFIETFGKPDATHTENEIGVFVYGKTSRLKIAVYAISKNESMFVERFCTSAKDADLILIADTGSTDNTVALAKQHGATVYNIAITPWRFDKARDAALALIPRDFDVCISLDLDEELQEGWREEIEKVWQENTTRLRYKFDWGVGIVFYYEKIHHRHGYHWHHPCHEYPVADKRITEVWAQTDKLLVVHKPDPTKSRGQYLDLLKLAVDEDPRCPRNAFYYARELTFYKHWLEAVVALNKYLDMPEATWANERCYAMRLLGQCYEELGQDGTGWLQKACNEAPNTREPWTELAMIFYRRGEWQECYNAVQNALAIKDKTLVYTMDPSVWGAKPHDLAAISAFHLGFKDEAIEQGRLALSYEPDNQRLKSNLIAYEA